MEINDHTRRIAVNSIRWAIGKWADGGNLYYDDYYSRAMQTIWEADDDLPDSWLAHHIKSDVVDVFRHLHPRSRGHWRIYPLALESDSDEWETRQQVALAQDDPGFLDLEAVEFVADVMERVLPQMHSYKQETVVRMYIGGMTLKDAGAVVGVTESRAGQIMHIFRHYLEGERNAVVQA